MQKLACSHGLTPEGFLSQLQIVLPEPRKHSPTSLTNASMDKTCWMAAFKMPKTGFKYKAQLI